MPIFLFFLLRSTLQHLSPTLLLTWMNFLILSKIIAIQFQVTQVFGNVSSLSPITDALVLSHMFSLKWEVNWQDYKKYLFSSSLTGFVLSPSFASSFWLQVHSCHQQKFFSFWLPYFPTGMLSKIFKKSQRINLLIRWSRRSIYA